MLIQDYEYEPNEEFKRHHPNKQPYISLNRKKKKCPICKEEYNFLIESSCGDCYDVDHFVHETYRCLVQHYSGEPIK